MTNLNITNVGTQNPYKQFTYVVAANEVLPIYFSCNFVRVLELSSATDVKLRFGDKGTPTDLVGAGIGYELPEAVNVVTVINDSASSVTITLGLAIGRVFDDRLNISGAVQVASPTTRAAAAATVGTSASLILAANSSRKGWAVYNNGSATIYLGSTNAVTTSTGFPVLPGSTFGWDDTADIYAISGTAGQNVRVSYTGA